MDRLEKEKILEAALFMSPKPLTLDELNSIANNQSRLETKAMMSELISFYSTRKSALEITELPVGYQMRVKEDYEDYVSHFAQNSMFNRGVMKTLAFIAYKQPISQSVVVKYRNNKAYDHLKLLFDEGFIKKEAKGRTFLLTTTSKFIEYFGKDFGKAKKTAEKNRGILSEPATTVVLTQKETKSELNDSVNDAMEEKEDLIEKEGTQ
ncbi:MAG: SMC-Scp complex subunit ScpB [archaeon]|jgi:segregation and condensation protein B